MTQPVKPLHNAPVFRAVFLAIMATVLWSGNFIVARATIHDISPIHLAFGRWFTASLIMVPVGLGALKREWQQVLAGKWNIVFAGLFGISIFNTLVYVAGHHSEAIQIALLGTTSSPVFSFILARIFLKEKIPPRRILGLLVCIAGILFILSRGSWGTFINLRFSRGDWWILLAAFSFAVYNIFVRARPVKLGSVAYLTAVFFAGTLMLAPVALGDWMLGASPHMTTSLGAMIFYLGAGTSVGAFFCWNAAIAKLGAARASLFGMLIPVFSSIEAVLILGEKLLLPHILGMVLVFSGVFMANTKRRKH
jgi:drug/metabolite transporter (DMT)-like permease